jgi:hypothetical protein
MEPTPPKFELLPYTTVDGIPTMTDSNIARLYERIDTENTVKYLFLDGSVRCAADLINHFKRPGCMCYLVGYSGPKGQVVGFFWLDNFVQCSCQLHYAFFREYWGPTAVEVGRWVLREMITQRDIDGNFCIDVIIGIVPETNRLAVRYARSVLLQSVGVLPEYYFNFYRNRREAGLVTYFTRKEV